MLQTLQLLRTAFDDQGQGMQDCTLFHVNLPAFADYDVKVICRQIGLDSVTLQGVYSFIDNSGDLRYHRELKHIVQRGLGNSLKLYTPPYNGPVSECIYITLSDLQNFVTMLTRIRAQVS